LGLTQISKKQKEEKKAAHKFMGGEMAASSGNAQLLGR
jgi:hypothetical protein